MTAYLVVTTQEHTCNKCRNPIEIGAKAIKIKTRRSTCSLTEYGTAFVHEVCYHGGKK